MKRIPNDFTLNLHPVSLRIWEGMVGAMDRFTHDSYYSTFFQPEELVSECRSMAASFTLLHYNPLPTMQEIYKSRLYGLFFFTSVCGVQIFLKEYSFFNNSAPFSTEKDPKALRESKNIVLRQLAEGAEVSETINQVMNVLLDELSPIKERIKKRSKDYEFNEELFDKFLPITMVWGYLFAQEVVHDL